MEIGDIRYFVEPYGVIEACVYAINGTEIYFVTKLGDIIGVHCTSGIMYENKLEAEFDWEERYGRK